MRKIHMTGPEHYAESQRLLSRADYWTCGDGGDPYAGAALAAMAQGHAALAKIAHDSLGKTIPIDGTTATEWTRVLLGEAQS